MKQLSLFARWDPLAHPCEADGPIAHGIAGAFVPWPDTREPQAWDGTGRGGVDLHVIDAHPATGTYPPRWTRVLCAPRRIGLGRGYAAHARFDGACAADPILPGAPLTGPWGLVLIVTLTACDLHAIRLRRRGMFFEAIRVARKKATVKT